ncbi:MAG: hypothetical protein WC428_02185 [Candidatus Paceibacterota bacterium]|jgi:hypothetical protein
MKTKAFLFVLFFAIIAVSCAEKGTTRQKLNGDEVTLPDELKGLKVFTVATGGGNYVKVAVLNGQVNSLTYPVGKYQQTTIVVNKDRYNERLIEADKILFENDEMILIKKK